MSRAEILSRSSRRDDPTTDAGRRGGRTRGVYEPPRVDRCSRLDRAVQFGGSSIADSGGGLGNQPGRPPNIPRSQRG